MSDEINDVKVLGAISGVALPAGQIIDGTSGEIVPVLWNASPVKAGNGHRAIDFSWYEEQRVKLRSHEHQVALVNESLAKAWYKVIKRSLSDLPIHHGGRSVLDPEYGANMQAIATALGLSPRTLAGYRTAVSRIRNDEHFNEIIKNGSSWAQLVFSLGAGPQRRLSNADPDGPGLPPVKRRFAVQVPTQVADFLMENGLEAADVTAIVVAYLRQPKVQRELLKLSRLAAQRTA